LNDFPFDKQTLRLNIASTNYMLNEVELVPLEDQQFSGLRKGFFDGEEYLLKDFGVKAYKDVDGHLKKSRGSMEIEVTRSNARFLRNFLLPAALYMAIACAVFWLPFLPTFVTPRIALSIFILLVFTNLASTADEELPAAAPYNWIDLFCFAIQLHMFAVVCLNIFTEVAYHSMKCTVTALYINNELKVLAPSLALATMVSILVASTKPEGPLSLEAMAVLVPLMFCLFLVTYMSCCGSTLSAELARNKRADNVKAQEYTSEAYGAGMGTMGPLASSESLAPAPAPTAD